MNKRKLKKILRIVLPEQVYKRIVYYKVLKENSIGNYCNIDDYSTLDEGVMLADYSDLRNSKIKKLTSIGKNSRIMNSEVGKYCSISWNVTVGAISHPYENITTHAFAYVPEIGGFTKVKNQLNVKTIIENDVWIGCNSVILPGIKVENGAVIGAGSVVTKSVPPYAIVVGVPAKVIGYRFTMEQIDKLQQIKWWNFEKNIIKKYIQLFNCKGNDEIISELEEISRKLKV